MKFNKEDRKLLTPAGVDLFKEDTSKKLGEQERELFHRTVAKCQFMAKRARPDIQTTVAVLCSRIQAPCRKDWLNLVRLMKFLSQTEDEILTLSARKSISVLEWYINTAFGFHPEYKGHTGGVLRFQGGKGTIMQKSVKQKLNCSSSTTVELVEVDDLLPKVLWTPLFLEEQGYKVEKNIVFQDNTSAILLEKNGKWSLGERTRTLNICYFMIMDQVEKGHVVIEHCPTENMIGDFFTKPLLLDI